MLVVVLTSDIVWLLMCLFFFQAEDGIRDLVRSRGLGDVYKRQASLRQQGGRDRSAVLARRRHAAKRGRCEQCQPVPVSYTHLTLPTSDLV